LGFSSAEIDRFFEPRMHPIAIENDTRDGTVDGLTRDRWVKLREGIDEPTLAQIRALNLKGLTYERIYRRIYPSDGLAAHVVGYINKVGTPVTGVESNFDLYLR